MEHEESFAQASAFMQSTKLRLDNQQKLRLYGLYKQATEGACNTPRPGFFDMVGKAKWDAWAAVGSISKEEAMGQYVDFVGELCPTWGDQKAEAQRGGEEGHSTDESSGGGSGDAGAFGIGGPVFSSLADHGPKMPDSEKDVFDWCKEGNTERLAEALAQYDDVNQKDEQGMTLLHWACDRGSADVVSLLLSQGVDVNTQDESGQTALHYAASCGHEPIVRLLVAAGVDVGIADEDGTTALEAASSQPIRDLLAK